MSIRTVVTFWTTSFPEARAYFPWTLINVGRVGASKTYALCPPIMTPPPITLHVMGYIFCPQLSSVLDTGEDTDSAGEPESSISDSGEESGVRMEEGSCMLQKVIARPR